MKVKGEKVSSGPGYFQDLTVSLHHLCSHERFTDLVFMCSDGPVYCHKAMLSRHSSFMESLFAISAAKQSSDTTVISLPEVDKGLVAKLMQYLYQVGERHTLTAIL